MNIVSSLNAIERLSKFIVPTDDQMPSTTTDFACIIDAQYSNTRTPPASSSRMCLRPAK